MTWRRTIVALLLLFWMSACSVDREWTDTTGRSHRVLDADAGRATVLLFIATDCPIANAYAPELSRIVDDYEKSGVVFFAVHADPDVSPEAAARHAEEFGFRCPVLLDPRQELARRVGATVTPEAAVLDAGGKIVYLGRIDDLFYGFGKRRAAATKHELRDAIDAVLAGRPVAKPGEPPFGCEIPPLKETQ
jgi:thiol-disulfide isomerase/thioredoxin